MTIVNFESVSKINEKSALLSTTKGPKTSSRYLHIPTFELKNEFENNGFILTKYNEARVNKKENLSFQKHLLVFTHKSMLDENLKPVRENIPQLLLTNSHMGNSTLQIHYGVYRAVCANGLVIGNTFLDQRFRHSGNASTIEQIKKIIETMPEKTREIDEVITKMSSIKCSSTIATEITVKTIELALKDKTSIQFSKDDLINILRPQRPEDQKTDIYTIFNVAQEKLMRGGISYIQDGKRKITRPIKSIDRTIKVNKELFDFTLSLVS